MKPGNQPVYPTHTVYQDCGLDGNSGPHLTETIQHGITLRQHFAGLAMQALLSNPNVVGYNSSCGWGLVNCTDDQLSNMCAGHADSLLAALEKQNDPT